MKKRKSNRLKGYDYSKNNLYFVTNCVKNNLCCLGNVISVGTGRDLSVPHPEIHHPEIHHPEIHHPEIHPPEIHHPENYNSNNDFMVELNEYGLIVDKKINWLQNQYEYVEIHNYVVMPNHFHFILEIDSLKVKDKEVKIKSVSSLLGALKTTSSNEIHKLGFEDFAWHRSFHDHIIRDENSYQNISNYIDLNPQKWFQDKFYNKD
jgi:REP element-mobilizing transposase RayT